MFTPGVGVMFHQPIVVNVQIGVAIHHHGGGREEPFSQLQGARRAAELSAFARILDLNPKRTAVTVLGGDQVGHMSDAKNESSRTLIAQQFQLQREERGVTDRRQRLRPILDHGSETCA